MKVIFFDIDGTLVPLEGYISDSTKEAIARAKEKGNKIFLCSGRSRTQLVGPVKELPYDGIVAAAGACIEIGGEVVYESVVAKEEEEKFLRLFENEDVSFGVQTKDGIYTTKRGYEKTRERFLQAGCDLEQMEENIALFNVVDDLRNLGPVEKLFYNRSNFTIDYVKEYLGDYFHVELSSFDINDKYSGEITVEGVNKATGMEYVLKHYGLTQADSVAFGDGPNDLDMLSYANLGIAMGNAIADAKEAADYVTDDIYHDGIYKAMKKFGII